MDRSRRPEISPSITLCFCFLFLLQNSFVYGGVCWATVNEDGRCTDVIQRSPSISKADCCRIAGGRGAWTSEDYDSGQTFFWSALGGGAPNCKACSHSCDGIVCPERETCSLRNGSPRCSCPTSCPSDTPDVPLVPVCSGEGITYRSECHMKKRNCRLHLIDFISYEGYCQHSCETVKCKDDQHCIEDADHQPYCVRCMQNCPDIYVPMCGTDGVTYDSMCHLNLAACRDKTKDIKYAHRGPCNASLESCDELTCKEPELCVMDTKHNRPRCVRCDLDCSLAPDQTVCGSDGLTYLSWCEMRKNSCIFGALIHIHSMGECTHVPVRPAIVFNLGAGTARSPAR